MGEQFVLNPNNPNAHSNEQLKKKLNDKYYEAAEKILTLDEQRRFSLAFYCECADTRCHDRVNLSMDAYCHSRGINDAFIVHTGHEMAGQNIVQSHADYVLVAKKLS